MKNIILSAAAILLIFAALFLSTCGKKKEETMRISGSTTIARYIKKAGELYGKEVDGVRFAIFTTGSMNGISDVVSGDADIAMSSSEITLEQSALAKAKGISLKAFLLGYDVVVPFVNTANTVDHITITQLKDIYAGTLLRWNKIGGADTVIDVVDHGLSSGTRAVWHHALDDNISGTGMKITESRSNSAVLAYIAGHENSIGYLSAAYLNPEVKALKLDGVDISRDDSLLSRYNLKRPLLLYVNEARITPEMKGFIAYLLLNPKGRSLLGEAGFFPVYVKTDLFES